VRKKRTKKVLERKGVGGKQRDSDGRRVEKEGMMMEGNGKDRDEEGICLLPADSTDPGFSPVCCIAVEQFGC